MKLEFTPITCNEWKNVVKKVKGEACPLFFPTEHVQYVSVRYHQDY